MENRDFKGIWIPKEIWLDKRLNAIEKMILMEIDSLDVDDGCYASNQYLAEFCGCSETKVSLTISKLIDCGFLYVASFDGRTRILKSRLSKNERQDFTISKSDSQKMKEINIDENNKRENININKENIKEIIDYLNEKTKKHFRVNNANTVKFINARLNDGFTIDDFKKVIDNKTSQWLNTSMDQYLRPQTLFAPTNFESYLNEKTNGKTTQQKVEHAYQLNQQNYDFNIDDQDLDF